MSGLETAIKNALDRADRTNAEVRARIYQSARQALETGLRKQDVTDPSIVAAQRHRLETTIRTIEQEERQKLGIVMADPAAELDYGDLDEDLELEGERRDGGDEVAAEDGLGSLRAERLGEGATQQRQAAAPDVVAGGASRGFSADAPAGRTGAAAGRQAGGVSGAPRRRKRRGLFARLFVWLILLAFIAMGAWWAFTSGLFLTDAERDTSVANPPAAVSEDDIAPPASSGNAPSLDSANSFSPDWIEIFKPGDPAQVVAGTAAQAALSKTSDGAAVRITSTSAADEGAVRILLPADKLKLAAGAQATIAVSLRSASDKPVELTIGCDFGGQAGCERHRFTVTSQRSEALLQVTPQAGSTDAAGAQPALVLNSDMQGQGGGVDLFAIRLLPVP